MDEPRRLRRGEGYGRSDDEMAIFTESMNPIDPSNPENALKTIDEYIRYMCERMEFSQRNMTRVVSAAGVSNAELLILLQAQSQTLAALQSTVNQMGGNVTSLAGSVATLTELVGTLQEGVTGMTANIEHLREDISSLDERVTALEGENNTPTPTE